MLRGRLGCVSLAAGALALTLAACGSSAPRQAEVDAPRDQRRRAGPAGRPAPVPERRRERRSERRAAEDASAEAAAAVLEPVPEAAAAGYARALAALRAEDWLEAELELEQLTLEHPEYPGPHVNSRSSISTTGGATMRARSSIARSSVEPGHAAANTQLGILLREDGKFEEAEAAYRRALETNPDHALAHYNLGVLLDIYLRRTAEALAHYEAYQASLAQPNETVRRWIIDLRRRVGNGSTARASPRETVHENRADGCSAVRRRQAPALKSPLHRNGARRSRTSTTSSRPSTSAAAACRRNAAPPPRRLPLRRRKARRGAEPAADRPVAAGHGHARSGTTSITGNAELPKVLYIVPWKKSDLGDLVGRPVNTLLDEVLAPVDPAVFERHLSYYDSLYGEREQE